MPLTKIPEAITAITAPEESWRVINIDEEKGFIQEVGQHVAEGTYPRHYTRFAYDMAGADSTEQLSFSPCEPIDADMARQFRQDHDKNWRYRPFLQTKAHVLWERGKLCKRPIAGDILVTFHNNINPDKPTELEIKKDGGITIKDINPSRSDRLDFPDTDQPPLWRGYYLPRGVSSVYRIQRYPDEFRTRSVEIIDPTEVIGIMANRLANMVSLEPITHDS